MAGERNINGPQGGAFPLPKGHQKKKPQKWQKGKRPKLAERGKKPKKIKVGLHIVHLLTILLNDTSMGYGKLPICTFFGPPNWRWVPQIFGRIPSQTPRSNMQPDSLQEMGALVTRVC